MQKRPSPLAVISRDLSRAVDRLNTERAAAFTYNPLSYARVPHEDYLDKYGDGPKEVLLLGMNPGPFGMAQTGVPFGDVAMVRDFLRVSGKVGRPTKEHPKRLITGFECPRSEVSGTRLWGFAKEHFKTPERFFKRFFVVNYCPLVFMEASAKNLTPDKLPKDLRDELNDVCDDALRKIVRVLEPKWVLGVGAFAQKQAERALVGSSVKIGTVLHPSPASPKANKGWSEEVARQLAEMDIRLK
jgi:single-strand selective monofunctional uracil DNA glycosylase